MKDNKKVYYISPYLPDKELYIKHYSPAAQAKVGYIRKLLKRYNCCTVGVNCSLTVDNKYFKKKVYFDEYGECLVLPSKSSINRVFLPLNGVIMLLSVFFFVLFKIHKEDTVILYHSVYYDGIIRLLKRIKKFYLIYEVEEIYADVRNQGKGRLQEIKQCNNEADAFIFPTELLDEIVNIYNKPSVVIYGAYEYDSGNKTTASRNTLKKKIIVYSGTLMSGKGATQAIESCKYLDKNYEVRIIGYGSEEEIKNINRLIETIQSECIVKFDGMKYGQEYIEYLKACDIGLCIQPEESRFNGSSFPSKILSYMNNNLKVVATEIPALKKSKLSRYICFAESSEPIHVANAIKEIENIPEQETDYIIKLHAEAVEKIRGILRKEE